MAHDGKRRMYFRVIRTDEDVNCIEPKKKDPDERPIRDQIREHIEEGSKTGFESSLISMTAELNVALAFAGIISRVCLTDLSDKKPSEVIHLDKEYLRTIMTDEVAKSRSRRSDEVLVLGRVTSAKLLPIEMKTCQRTLAKGFEKSDEDIFPSDEELHHAYNSNKFETIESLSGSNKRLFKVKINDENFVAILPRPNYSLERPVLFDKDLVDRCRHHFTCYCAYRCLVEDGVPKAALYEFKLSVTHDDLPEDLPIQNFEWAMILLEDLSLENLDMTETLELSKNLFAADILLGNWECAQGIEKRDLISQKYAMYGRIMKNNKIVRYDVCLSNATYELV